MLNRAKIFFGLFLMMGFALSGGESWAAASKRLNGTIYLIDANDHSVTIKDDNGTLTTFNVTRKSKLLRNNKKVALNGLVAGDQAAISYDGSNNANQIGAKGPKVNTLRAGVLGVRSGSGEVETERGNFGTDSRTRVVRNGKIASLNSLTLFDDLTVHLRTKSPSSKGPGADDTAADIQAEGPQESEVRGTINGVDAGAGRVTITPKNGGADVTVNVTVNTLIEIGGAPATINDLIPGLAVEAEYDPLTFDAFRIEAENEGEDDEIAGTIAAVDTILGTVTINDAQGTPVTLSVDASTKIKRNDVAATLADLQAGDPVKAEFNIVTLRAKEIEAGTENESETETETENEHD